ncbi:MAG: hypothetical protein ORN54_12130 [Cyclobacteriaceae bacterium]|nr:hypothetical protein [Cyclobacteriaceae bacterium]
MRDFFILPSTTAYLSGVQFPSNIWGVAYNIGREAFQNIFNLPADYNNLTENQEFNKEIYGFKDYTQSRLGIVGLTGKFNLSSNLELFVGTYNSYTKDGVGSQTTQRFFEIDTNYQFKEQKANTDYVSKNKVDLQYNTDKIKANYNFNAVLSDKALNSLNQYSVDNFEFKTNKSNNVKEYYQNILFEYRLNKKVALHTKAFFGLSNKNIFFDLVHNQPLYIKYLYDDSGVAVFNFDQSIIEERKEFASDSRLQVQNKLGSFQIGFQYFSEQRDITKQAYKNINDEKVRLNNSLFNGETPILTYTKMMPYASHRFTIGKVILLC